jgi:hypothetical protein
MSGSYQNMIIEDTGCTPSDAIMIENIMRDEIFHSTLDWQSRAEFSRGARRAYQLLKQDRAFYEEASLQLRAVFEEGRRREVEVLR